MGKTTTVTVQIDRVLKRDVDQILGDLGLSASEAILLFYQQVQEQRGLPFNIRLVNRRTRQALHDAEARRNLTTHAGSAALFADLGIER